MNGRLKLFRPIIIIIISIQCYANPITLIKFLFACLSLILLYMTLYVCANFYVKISQFHEVICSQKRLHNNLT
jgi:hypothetical protein